MEKFIKSLLYSLYTSEWKQNTMWLRQNNYAVIVFSKLVFLIWRQIGTRPKVFVIPAMQKFVNFQPEKIYTNIKYLTYKLQCKNFQNHLNYLKSPTSKTWHRHFKAGSFSPL